MGMNFMDVVTKEISDLKERTQKVESAIDKLTFISEEIMKGSEKSLDKLSDAVNRTNDLIIAVKDNCTQQVSGVRDELHELEIKVVQNEKNSKIDNLKQDNISAEKEKQRVEKKLSFWEKHTDKFIGGLITAILIPAVIFLLKNASAFMATVK